MFSWHTSYHIVVTLNRWWRIVEVGQNISDDFCVCVRQTKLFFSTPTLTFNILQMETQNSTIFWRNGCPILVLHLATRDHLWVRGCHLSQTFWQDSMQSRPSMRILLHANSICTLPWLHWWAWPLPQPQYINHVQSTDGIKSRTLFFQKMENNFERCLGLQCPHYITYVGYSLKTWKLVHPHVCAISQGWHLTVLEQVAFRGLQASSGRGDVCVLWVITSSPHLSTLHKLLIHKAHHHLQCPEVEVLHGIP